MKSCPYGVRCVAHPRIEARTSKLRQPVDPACVLAEDRRLRELVEFGQELASGSEPSSGAAGELNHRPIGREQYPLGTEAVEGLLDVRAEIVDAPVRSVSLRGEPGKLAHDVRQASELPELPCPRLEAALANRRLAEVVEHELRLRARFDEDRRRGERAREEHEVDGEPALARHPGALDDGGRAREVVRLEFERAADADDRLPIERREPVE